MNMSDDPSRISLAPTTTTLARSETLWFRFMMSADRSRWKWILILIVTMIFGVGGIDYLSGFRISFGVFYLLPVCLAVVSLGRIAGVITALFSVAVWLSGDIAAGGRYGSAWVPFWNGLIAFGTYLVVIWLLDLLLASYRETEERVKVRTAALINEVAERKRLEQEILDIGEQERRRIGHELHDGLSQHLTGTALVAQWLGENLDKKDAEEAGTARRIVTLIGEAINQTHSMAQGLLPAEIEEEELIATLHELAAATREQFRVECEFSFNGKMELLLPNGSMATHLHRIAQEAVRNAARHSKARRIDISLVKTPGMITLAVADDGVGLPPPSSRKEELGLRIMANRASFIGADFRIDSTPGSGTCVICRLPVADLSDDQHKLIP
ncbi:MAG: sensor histidine kinase [Syntrophorhabdaceae bacterium]|nr:sensor histidine kinase [Syntrophorhabdaceae bacterium]